MAVRGCAQDYGGGVTYFVVMICLLAASCGLIFGYSIAVSGGVTQMESFLSKFFPEVLSGMKSTKRDSYCKYNNQLLTAFTSSLFVAGMFSSLVASHVTRRLGRQAVLLMGGMLFLVGSICKTSAINIAMLIIGRMLIGFGLGFTLQAAPLYLSETAPARWRGAFASALVAFLSIGILSATVTNYFADRIPVWGWRVSLGVVAVPSAIITVGAIFVPDTPSSLAMRGFTDRARLVLQRIRGPDADVDAEFKDIVCAVEEARKNNDGAFRRLFSKEYRHYLLIGIAIPVFYELTGMVVMASYSPLLFRTVGFGSQMAILGSVMNGIASLVSTMLATFVVDRTGRRFLFIMGGMGMMLCQVAISWIMACHLGKHQIATMSRGYAMSVLVLVCISTFHLGLSWAPLRLVVPSEMYPMEIRSAGQAMSVSIALCASFIDMQVYITLLCTMKYGVFLFYVAWLLVMTVFVVLFLPETKGMPLETMRSVFSRHWYWRTYVNNDKQEHQ
ncbi:hypothetical protein EJB05_12859, partial [Eragrostis curvula]